jgi:hypothetical protein
VTPDTDDPGRPFNEHPGRGDATTLAASVVGVVALFAGVVAFGPAAFIAYLAFGAAGSVIALLICAVKGTTDAPKA